MVVSCFSSSAPKNNKPCDKPYRNCSKSQFASRSTALGSCFLPSTKFLLLLLVLLLVLVLVLAPTSSPAFPSAFPIFSFKGVGSPLFHKNLAIKYQRLFKA